MVILIKLFGIVVVIMGAAFLINPKLIKQYIGFWQQQKRLYMGGIIALLLGIIFLLAASQCKLPWVLMVLGIISIAKAIFIFTRGLKGFQPMMNWWLARPDSFLRVYSLIVIAMGALIIYSV